MTTMNRQQAVEVLETFIAEYKAKVCKSSGNDCGVCENADAAIAALRDEAGAEALLLEVSQELDATGCGACIGSDAPMEDLHGRIAKHLRLKPYKHCRACHGTGGLDNGSFCDCVYKGTRPAPQPVVCEVCEELCDKIGNGYVPRGGNRSITVVERPAPQPERDYPECSGNPASCPENEGYGCCKPNPKPDDDMVKLCHDGIPCPRVYQPEGGVTEAMVDSVTDHLCEQEYDIGGREELRKHVAAALEAALAAQPKE